jgi:hypothetical protein
MMPDGLVLSLWRFAALLRHPKLHAIYLRRARRIPDVAFPHRYSERMLWRKLFDRNPLFVTFADKLATKDWIHARCPDLPIPRTLWVGTDPADIPPELIRPGVAVKANHGSTFNLLIRDTVPERSHLIATCRRWLSSDWGRHHGEWHYGKVQRRIFLEELVGGDGPLFDLQVRAGGGRVGLCSIVLDAKTRQQSVRYMDPEGRIVMAGLDPSTQIPSSIATPRALQRAVIAARRLSVDVDFARFDFLSDGEHLWAGEVTIFPAAGYGDFQGETFALAMMAWDLRYSWFLREGSAGGSWLQRRYGAALTRALQDGRAR